MTKFSHFMAVKITDLVEDYDKLYINEIVRLHGFHCLSAQIEVFSLPRIYGSHFRRVLVLKLTLAQHFIHKRMDRQSVQLTP